MIPKAQNEIFTKAEAFFRAGTPFVLYSLPQSGTLCAVFSTTVKTKTETASFIFAPFATEEESYKIDFTETIKTPIVVGTGAVSKKTMPENKTDRKAHLILVAKAVSAIKKGKVPKIVVSRKREITLKKFNLKNLMYRLFSQPDNSFRYLWYHPQTAIWCGATPEVLIETAPFGFKTVALAGTKKGASPTFTQKEMDEQQFVTAHIQDKLGPLVKTLHVGERRTHNAGNVSHLRTDIWGTTMAGKNVQQLIFALHPTPAVCGTPTGAAKNFIAANENYQREFYTGYLGLIGATRSALFVNIRCMKIAGGTASVYAGGGITAQSDPEREWRETQHKMQAVLQLLADFF